MALVVFLRGINVGGHRRFRPTILAKELSGFDAVNVGAAGTLVVRRPGSRAKLLAELVRKLPFEAEAALFYASAGRRMVRACDCLEGATYLWSVSPPHEDDQVSGPDR